jgi:hypothetical protein
MNLTLETTYKYRPEERVKKGGFATALYLLMLFLDGFNSVYPMEKLHSFSPTELASLLCGDQTPEVSKVKFYTKESFIDMLILLLLCCCKKNI